MSVYTSCKDGARPVSATTSANAGGMNNIVSKVFSFSFETKRKRNKRKVFAFRNYSACGYARTVGTQQGIAKTLLFYYAEQVRNDMGKTCTDVARNVYNGISTNCTDASCRDAINCVSATTSKNDMSVYTSCRDGARPVSATTSANAEGLLTNKIINHDI